MGFEMMSLRKMATVAAAAISVISLSTTTICQGEETTQSASEKKLPNFIFFLVDDLGYTDLGCYGSTFHETPNLDKLAASGVQFTNAYAACPVCSPSRAAFLTGKYPARLGTTDFFGAPQPTSKGKEALKKLNSHALLPAPYVPYLDLEEVTVAEALKEHGYATYIGGKWHLGNDEYEPTKQGFDVNKGAHQAGHPKSYTSPYGNPKLKNGPNGEYLTDRLASETVTFINDHKDQPFFVYMPFYNVHTPLQGRPDLVEKYEKKRKALGLEDKFGKEGLSNLRENQTNPVYAAMVESVDMAVGTVLDALEKNGVADNTIVMFTSDNGGLSTGKNAPTSNLPWRAGKGWMYEAGIKAPLIIRWPGVTKAGSKSDAVTIGTDFYPTMLEMAGLPAKPRQHLDGESIVSAIKDSGSSSAKERDIFWHYPHYGNQGGRPSSAVRSGKWKLINWYDGNKIELFDLEKDPYEKNDVADDNPEVTKDLKSRLIKWLSSVGAKFPTPNPNFKK